MEPQKTDEVQKRSSRSIAGVLGMALKSLATVIIIVLLALQAVELGLILDKVSALEGRQQSSARPALAASPSPLAEGESETVGVKVELLAVEADDDGLALTLEVHQSGPSALFFQQPTLQGKRGETYELDLDSLQKAKFALLDVVTRGQAEIELCFILSPGEEEDLTLIFNPDHPQDDPVAPRIEIPIEPIKR